MCLLLLRVFTFIIDWISFSQLVHWRAESQSDWLTGLSSPSLHPYTSRVETWLNTYLIQCMCLTCQTSGLYLVWNLFSSILSLHFSLFVGGKKWKGVEYIEKKVYMNKESCVMIPTTTSPHHYHSSLSDFLHGQLLHPPSSLSPFLFITPCWYLYCRQTHVNVYHFRSLLFLQVVDAALLYYLIFPSPLFPLEERVHIHLIN